MRETGPRPDPSHSLSHLPDPFLLPLRVAAALGLTCTWQRGLKVTGPSGKVLIHERAGLVTLFVAQGSIDRDPDSAARLLLSQLHDYSLRFFGSARGGMTSVHDGFIGEVEAHARIRYQGSPRGPFDAGGRHIADKSG